MPRDYYTKTLLGSQVNKLKGHNVAAEVTQTSGSSSQGFSAVTPVMLMRLKLLLMSHSLDLSPCFLLL